MTFKEFKKIINSIEINDDENIEVVTNVINDENDHQIICVDYNNRYIIKNGDMCKTHCVTIVSD